MPLQSNFMADYAGRCLERLMEAGYIVNAGDDREIIRCYLSIRHRRIRSTPRTFHQAPYFVPPALAVGHAMLRSEVGLGKDLWPRQSRKITKTAIEDGMLNDFGIQHFHLGRQPDTRHPGLVQGTAELLFATVADTDFYAIGIYSHSNWSLQDLLDVMHKNWPAVNAAKSAGNISGVAVTYSDEEVAALRKAGINAITRRTDGTLQIGPGGGLGTDGTSGAVTRELIRLEAFIGHYEKLVVEDFEDNARRGLLKDGSKVQLIWRDGHALATSGDLEMDLLGNLPVPML